MTLRTVTRRWSAALVAVGLLLGAAACSSSGSPKPQKSQLLPANGTNGSFQGLGLTPAQPRPSFVLDGTDGKPVSFASLTAGHPTLLYFGYTNCPDVCPATMADIQGALAKVPKAVAQKTYVVFVSTDVKRDTASVITRWLANFDAESAAHWVGLRGTQTQIDAAQAAAHVTLAEDGGATHSAQVLLYGPDDYAHVSFLQGNTEQQQIQHDLQLVAAGRTS